MDRIERNRYFANENNEEKNAVYSRELYQRQVKKGDLDKIKVSKLKSETAVKIITELDKYDKFIEKQKNTERKNLRIPSYMQSGKTNKSRVKSFKKEKIGKSKSRKNMDKIKSHSAAIRGPIKAFTEKRIGTIELSKDSAAKKEYAERIKHLNKYGRASIILKSPKEIRQRMKMKEDLPLEHLRSKKKKTRIEKLGEKFNLSRYSNHGAYDLNLMTKRGKSSRKEVLGLLNKMRSESTEVGHVSGYRSMDRAHAKVYKELKTAASNRILETGMNYSSIFENNTTEFPDINARRSGLFDSGKKKGNFRSHRNLKDEYNLKLMIDEFKGDKELSKLNRVKKKGSRNFNRII